MKIVMPGGTGHLGRLLTGSLRAAGHEVVVLSRRPDTQVPGARVVPWDGRTTGEWAAELDGADAVINLAGRSVNCRYTEANLREMMASRVDSATVVGAAIAQAARPPRVWLQMSTATIYAHTYEHANDEATGVLGGSEAGVPAYWAYSVDIARKWEQAQADAATPDTRKVALRTSIVMAPARGGAFDMLLRLTRSGLGGPVAGGRQYMSWIHGDDLARAVDLLLDRDDVAGPVNLATASPLPMRAFMAALREAAGVPIGLPATRWMAELGALVLRSDTELLLKSRRVVPGRLLDAGFAFEFPTWPEAAHDLVARAGETDGVRPRRGPGRRRRG
ncbi:TIGR01777 family protein [Frankia sp. AgB1.9]|uniref:TIGR01777 family oxidoreductase n=1 Tax=unclassified Frankia TaxID=2632575 RepID=UPI00193258AC|nr:MULTISPECIES: TIGR01777 family oxidoreductase [unclassified Frankia]MBL7493450.1 TIGR01777 family protein [Frankia sp. AgW1.1]MBL7548598.1 TIGR01777 family protein [Frankia sp. AgB1.9]MBL7623378.1 TIGR01777 family oxidoreductase [Frankia sp. AgB1.8]